MKQYLLAIDQGTTGTTGLLIDTKNFSILDKENREFPQIYPRPGHVEHNLLDIWGSVQNVIEKLLQRNHLSGKELVCIGITNQRETTCAFDKKGNPLFNAIVWQDRRTSEFCEKLKKEGIEKWIKEKTGLPIDPYFSGSKIHWLLQNVPEIQKAKARQDLCFGTIDTFLLYKLTGHEVFATEPTNASRTLLMDLISCQWDPELLKIFGVQQDCLPTIKDSFNFFGKTKNLSFLPDGIPITGILGDQQAALLGQNGQNEGGMKCTYGTGAFMLLNIGKKVRHSQKGLITTVAYKWKNEIFYSFEGSCYIAGAAVQWLRDQVKIISRSDQIEPLARQVSNLVEMEHLLFLPFFSGLASPYWLPEAKGSIIGITRDTSAAHLARACLDGIALSINDLYSGFKDDGSVPIKELCVDGGACANNLLLEIQATILGIDVVRPRIIETTAFGAALGAAVGVGIFSLPDIKKYWQQEKVFSPNPHSKDFYAKKIKQWKEIIARLHGPL